MGRFPKWKKEIISCIEAAPEKEKEVAKILYSTLIATFDKEGINSELSRTFEESIKEDTKVAKLFMDSAKNVIKYLKDNGEK